MSSQETSPPGPPVDDGRKKEMNTSPPEADQNQDMCYFTPSPFRIKAVWILTQARWFFGTLVPPPSSSSAGFLNKVTIPSPTHLQKNPKQYKTKIMASTAAKRILILIYGVLPQFDLFCLLWFRPNLDSAKFLSILWAIHVNSTLKPCNKIWSCLIRVGSIFS